MRLTKPNGYWTTERCIERARQFSKIADWQAGCPGSFDASRHNGSYDRCVAHMRQRRRRGSITPDICKADSARFSSRSEWKRAAHATFEYAKSNGLLDELTSHMNVGRLPNGHWTLEACTEAAAKFESRNAWRWGDFKSYDAARRAGWIDEVADAAGMPRFEGRQAQSQFAEACRHLITGSNIEMREEVPGLAGQRTKVDIAFYRDGAPFLVVEYQGAYWHSEACGKDRKYHRDRMLALREKGIRLITVHEKDADNPVILAMVGGALGLIRKQVRASKCQVIHVGNGAARAFFEASHIQGGTISGKDQFNLGLELNGRLVACMTFVRSTDRHTGSGSYDWCLHRFSTAPDCRVRGAAGRLFKRFREAHPLASVVSYCDLQFFTGATYASIGFRHVRDNQPDYAWVRGTTVVAKHDAQRKHLPNLLRDGFDPSLSERENMERSGYSKFWDCGKAVYAFVPAQ